MATREIRLASDVTEAHIEEAADCREGLYGGVPLDWHDTIAQVEGRDEDWGDSMESEAIRYLQRETRKRLRERREG